MWLRGNGTCPHPLVPGYNMQMKSWLLFLQIVVLAIIGFLYLHLGIGESFFWVYWWWDIPLHILGGVWAALFAAWVYTILGGHARLSIFLFGALLIGVAWELLEFVGEFPRSPHFSYPVDTAKDIVMDCIGGAIAWGLAKLRS